MRRCASVTLSIPVVAMVTPSKRANCSTDWLLLTSRISHRVRAEPRLFQSLHVNVPIGNELLGMVAPAVDLERDAAFIDVALLVIGEVHELDAVDPGLDCGRVAGDLGLERIPLAVFPEGLPFFGRD